MEHRITIMTIDHAQIRCLYHDISIEDSNTVILKKPMHQKAARLYDGIGAGIATWRALSDRHTDMGKRQVSIFTNGSDGGSTKYSTCTLRSIINSLTKSNWQFTVIGNHPALPTIANKLGIKNYYLCNSLQSKRDRHFLISQLKRQWYKQHQHTTIDKAETNRAA